MLDPTNLLQIENILANFLNTGIVVFLFLYLLFSVLIIRQIQLMSAVIISGVNKFLVAFSIFHFLFALIFFTIYLINLL